MNKALLFINGLEPKNVIQNKEYKLIGCTDGAYKYARSLDFTLDFIIGDFDSIQFDVSYEDQKFILAEDQNKTDFEKALEYLISQGITDVDVYGATGLEHDHFLGNISTAIQLKDKIKIIFYDEYGMFYFAEKKEKIITRKGATISLIPFYKVEKIETKGLQYSLNKEDLEFGTRIGTRNKAIHSEVEILHKKGNLLLFVGN
ncbi:MAG: thiamine diphosphokinase [Flavobacteriales bacterium]|nr:thiamine diphosphokinase [Flavobacteriales bacterium]